MIEHELIDEAMDEITPHVADVPLDDRPRIDPDILAREARRTARCFESARRAGKRQHEVAVCTYHETDVIDYCSHVRAAVRVGTVTHKRVESTRGPRWTVRIEL